MRVGSMVQLGTCLAASLAAFTMTLALVPQSASADPALSAKWKASLQEKSGEHAWLGKWILDDRCQKNGLAACGHLGDAVAGAMPTWPATFFADALTVEWGMGKGKKTPQSAVCIDAFGCDLIVPALEILAASRKPASEALLFGWLADAAHWKDYPFSGWRGMYLRLIAWWGDRSKADLVAKMAAHVDGQSNHNAGVVANGAWLLSTWGDKALLPACTTVWKGELRGDGVDQAKDACALYALRVGDAGIKAHLDNYGSGFANTLVRAAVGDKSKVADWTKEIAPLDRSPDHERAAVYAAALAAVGDKAGTKAADKAIKTCKPGAIRAFSRALTVLEKTRWAVGARKQIANCLGKQKGDADLEGLALAVGAYVLLRSGDAKALPLMGRALASGDADTRREAGNCLTGRWGGMPISGPSNGLNGGVAIKGLGALLVAAAAKESDSHIKTDFHVALVMQKSAGGE